MVLALDSCAVYTHTMIVEMREKSASGLDLSGKSISMVCVTEQPYNDSSDVANFCNTFMEKLEKEYFAGDEGIEIFNVVAPDTVSYASRDSLVKYLMATESDLVFLKHGLNLYAYDSMNSDDTVLMLQLDLVNNTPEKAGERAAAMFQSTWRKENYTFYYFDGAKWMEVASRLAMDYNWKAAMDGWLELVNTENLQKKACAEYNIALCCYMMGQKDLAIEWLDRCDKDYPVALSAGLRKRITQK